MHGILNKHERPILFKAAINKQKIGFLDTRIFKDSENKNGLKGRSLNRQISNLKLFSESVPKI